MRTSVTKAKRCTGRKIFVLTPRETFLDLIMVFCELGERLGSFP